MGQTVRLTVATPSFKEGDILIGAGWGRKAICMNKEVDTLRLAHTLTIKPLSKNKITQWLQIKYYRLVIWMDKINQMPHK